MCVKLIRIPEAIAILIAQYPLNLKEILEATEYKKKTGQNPEGISVLLYKPDEKELAHLEYQVLSKETPQYIYSEEQIACICKNNLE